ncbi:MAG: hypothetical protein Q4B80_03205 [Aerococcaceae bacterium]|nr:hypothetical protein [Aerococcaceae bacterium]
MSVIKEAFDALLKKKELPAQYLAIEDGHHLYSFQFRLNQTQALMVEVILQNTDAPYCDAQVVYRQIHMVSDYAKRAKALEVMNDLNEMKTGYYALYLAGDGEMFLRTLLRVGVDPQPLYETIVYGSGIAKGLQADLVAALGASAKK